MSLRLIALLCVCGGLVAAGTPSCAPVDADRILARNLAEVLPAFRGIPPDTLLGNMPRPGSQRTFHYPELLSLAQRYGITLDADSSVCFERPMEALDHDRVLAAMRAALQVPDAHIELAETSLYPVPRGRIEFDLARLGSPATPDQRDPVLWRGDVVYGEQHRFAIWARVRILVPCTRIVAVEELRPGRRIDQSQLRAVADEGFPLTASLASGIDQFVGMVPLRNIAAGTTLVPSLVVRPNDINRGDLVEIEVRSGAARLVLTARAESAGHSGEMITVRNLDSNRTFPARVAGKAMAIVLADPPRVD